MGVSPEQLAATSCTEETDPKGWWLLMTMAVVMPVLGLVALAIIEIAGASDGRPPILGMAAQLVIGVVECTQTFLC